jgi:hypothetical protein
MALDATVLAGLITTKLTAAAPISTPAEMAQAIAEAVVEHITSAAVVVPTALIAPGGLSPAPVTGTGTVT